MTDPFRPVQAGQPLDISARAWNAMLEAARAEAQRTLNDAGASRDQSRNGSIIRVVNETGAALGRRSVVGLDSPMVTPDVDQDKFLEELIMRGVVPTAAHEARFGVTIEPAIVGQIARAYVDGLTQVRLNVTDPTIDCADVDPGDTTRLRTVEGGSAQVIWKQSDDPYYGDTTGEMWAVVRIGSSCGGSAEGAGTGPGRCDCPEDSYEVEVDCGDCGGYYGTGTVMPRFWWVELSAADAPYGYGEPCTDLSCNELNGIRILIAYGEDAGGTYGYGYGEGQCVWAGQGGRCVTAELKVGSEYWQLTLIDRSGCVLAVLFKAVEDFNCCGINGGWSQSAEYEDLCDVTVTLTPHECTCCPDPTCPPGDEPVCSATDCCLQDCDCQFNITVTGLGTPPRLPCEAFAECVDSEGNPCNFGDPDCWRADSVASPEQSCGGMNGVYAVNWAADCTWEFNGVPAGGSTKVAARLTLSGRTWTLRLRGEDGQVATFRLTDWDCNHNIILTFVEAESTCQELATTVATFNLCLYVS